MWCFEEESKEAKIRKEYREVIENTSIIGGSIGFFGNAYHVIKSLANQHQVVPKFRPFVQGGKGAALGFFAGVALVGLEELEIRTNNESNRLKK
ncbi:MAG: hypothetical protein ACD_46C00579G0003 [uncultured bacterium]|nr:MAG: hypothetical protein ACD_46C00579G0003 [uncultured bacterium]